MDGHPSAMRSKRLITEALLALLEERELGRIGVNELCARAGVSRPTFYHHFASKEAVLLAYVDQLFETFLVFCRDERLSSVEQLARGYFEFWAMHARFLRLMVEREAFGLMTDRFAWYLERVFEAVRFVPEGMTDEELRFHNAFLANGLAGMLNAWVQEGMETSPTQMARYAADVLALGA